MKQYLECLQSIKDRGTIKPPARQGMPSSLSLFGYQNRYNLQEGFPILTTKKMYWKGVVVELLWFLNADTNIKYLVDNGVNIWNEDAYAYYKKFGANNDSKGSDILRKNPDGSCSMFLFEEFVNFIKATDRNDLPTYNDYKLGDCGYQYGKVWRRWATKNGKWVDQIENIIKALKTNPESRRHMVTAIDPLHDTDLALYWCHALFQFNCRPLSLMQRNEIASKMNFRPNEVGHTSFDEFEIPKYYLDCQLYQRSADSFLGVPFNISSYSLLMEILAKMCNMIPGEFIHSFGDVHIYENHMEQVDEQLKRTPTELPKLMVSEKFETLVRKFNVSTEGLSARDFGYNGELNNLFSSLEYDDFKLEGYNPQSTIKAELSTGLIK